MNKHFSPALAILLATLSIAAHAQQKPEPIATSVSIAETAPAPQIQDIPGFAKLDQAIALYEKYVSLGGSWTTIGVGPKIEPGQEDMRITGIRERLRATGEYTVKKNPEQADLYDEELKNAVIVFQERHGLNNDGVIGKGTIQAMNVPAEKRLEQLKINQTRFEKIDFSLSDQYILVNIPDFTLQYVENNESKIQMRVVAGQPTWQTPLFSSKMTFLVLNPRWNVPANILNKEIAKKAQKDPDYIKKEGLRAFQTTETGKVEIDPATIDFSQSTSGITLQQDPGAGNALGKVKFMFPNKWDVYLHDTSSRSLFKNDYRALSHGCMRVQKPMDLMHLLLANNPNWPLEKIDRVLDGGKETVATLTKPVDVHIVYWTAWVDRQNRVHFRNDVYRKDRM